MNFYFFVFIFSFFVTNKIFAQNLPMAPEADFSTQLREILLAEPSSKCRIEEFLISAKDSTSENNWVNESEIMPAHRCWKTSVYFFDLSDGILRPFTNEQALDAQQSFFQINEYRTSQNVTVTVEFIKSPEFTLLKDQFSWVVKVTRMNTDPNHISFSVHSDVGVALIKGKKVQCI